MKKTLKALLTLSVLSFVVTLLNGQDIVPRLKTPKFHQQRQKRKLRRSQDPTEPVDWTCSYLNPNPAANIVAARIDYNCSYNHSRLDLDYSHCPTLEVGNISAHC
jgi:hypothetical protein